jgi:hypothetical protein
VGRISSALNIAGTFLGRLIDLPLMPKSPDITLSGINSLRLSQQLVSQCKVLPIDFNL